MTRCRLIQTPAWRQARAVVWITFAWLLSPLTVPGQSFAHIVRNKSIITKARQRLLFLF
jgi:hypothetical protein